MRQGRYQPKDAYGTRLDGEHYQLDGQPPVAQPTKNWGAPLVDVAKRTRPPGSRPGRR